MSFQTISKRKGKKKKVKKKICLQIFFAAAFLFFASAQISAQTATRINFYKNSDNATVSSNLRGYKDRKVYVVKVLKGQNLQTEQVKLPNSDSYITVSIKNPSGKEVGDADASCNNRKEINPTEAGDYTITVVQCRKADEWNGRFKLKVSVK